MTPPTIARDMDARIDRLSDLAYRAGFVAGMVAVSVLWLLVAVLAALVIFSGAWCW